MEWITIALLILAGIVLVIIEILFIPGTTIVGLIGGAFLVFGIIMGYKTYGTQTGTFILIGTLILGGTVTVISFKSGVWNKFSLKGSIDSKVNEGIDLSNLKGMKGVTTSSLRPYGKAEIEGNLYEVKTLGNYLKTGTVIEVMRIENKIIYVEPIKQ